MLTLNDAAVVSKTLLLSNADTATQVLSNASNTAAVESNAATVVAATVVGLTMLQYNTGTAPIKC